MSIPSISRPKIVYFGTPDFAGYILETLVEHSCDIVGVVTAPDRPSGRGQRVHPSAVKEIALKHSLPILQPDRLRDDSFLSELSSLEADLFIVVAFRMLPREVWAMPRLGTFNLHASLLPDFRGAAPIPHAILAGEAISGVTTFLLDEEIDTGRILLQEPLTIDPKETGGSLHDKLMSVGARIVLRTIEHLCLHGKEKSIPQDEFTDSLRRPAPKLFRADRELHFAHSCALDLDRRIRALNPYPSAIGIWHMGEETKEVKVHSAVRLSSHRLSAGDVEVTSDGRLLVGSTDGDLEITSLQLPSKRRMSTTEVLRGLHVPQGSYFE